MKKKAVCFGEILWDVLPTGEMPGGAPMNVAYHLHKLGISTNIITRIGNDDHGFRLVKLLESQGVDTRHIQSDDALHTGIVQATIGAGNEVCYEIVAPVAWDNIQLNDEMLALVSEADFFVFGSLCTRNHITRNTLFHLLDVAKNKVLDINLRAPHYTIEGLEALMKACNMLKLNEHELKLIAGNYVADQSEKAQMKLLQQQFNIETIVVTKGSEGALLLMNDIFYEQEGLPVAVADTIGSGDAFLAGLLYYLSENKTPQAAISFANKIGAFVATKNGACPAYEPYDIKF